MNNSAHRISAVALVMAIALASLSRLVVAAEIADLGRGQAEDINESGQIVGQGLISANLCPVLWPSGSTTPQPLTGNSFDCGSLYYGASGINESGQVTGGAKRGSFDPRGFLWDNGTMTDLGALATGVNSIASDINDAGQIVGAAYLTQPAGDEHAFFWESGQMQDLGTLGGGRSTATAINALGHVVGRADRAAGNGHAFLWQGNGLQDLGALAPEGASEAAAINDLGQVVGNATGSVVNVRAVIFQGGQVLNIDRAGLHTYPEDINNLGQIVGWSSVDGTGGTGNFPFLWQNGRLHDLCKLVNCDGWAQMVATAISDRGEIVGNGIRGDGRHAFLIKGLAEPYAAGRYVAFTNATGASLLARLRSAAGTGPVAVERVNSTTGAALSHANFFTGGGHSGQQVVRLANIGGSAAPELAVLATRLSDGQIRAEIRDADSRALLKTINLLNGSYIPVWLFQVPDLDNDSKVDLGLLAIRASDGRVVVKLAGSLSGAGIGSVILYGAGLTPVMAAALPDLDGSGAPDIAVLLENPGTGRFLVQIRNATGAAAPRNISFPDGYDPISFQVGPDTDDNSIPELAVLMRSRSDRLAVVEMRNAFGAAAAHRVTFAAGFEAAAFAPVADSDANSVPEWVAALDRTSDHRPYTQLRNASGSANVRTTAYHSTAYSVQHVVVLPDSDAIGGPDIGVIARRNSDGRVRMEIRNARGGGAPRAFFFSP